MSGSLSELLNELADQLPGCLHTSVIDGQTGLALVSVSEVDALDAAGTDAYHNDLYRLSEIALRDTPVSAQVNDVVLSSDEGTFVSIPIGKSGYRWLVVTGRDATVGFVQALMRKHVARIGDSLNTLTE